eukprot:14237312-Alexandrium_andersonii.AAC.1
MAATLSRAVARRPAEIAGRGASGPGQGHSQGPSVWAVPCQVLACEGSLSVRRSRAWGLGSSLGQGLA